jgi:hypothetical protein
MLRQWYEERGASAYSKPAHPQSPWLSPATALMLLPNIIVSGRYDQPAMVYIWVRPILAQPGEKVTGHVVLIDQYGS